MTPNVIAYFALAIWPLVGLFLFYRLPLNQAILWTILGGQLLLPVGAAIKFPMIPAFDKETIPNITALMGCVLARGRFPRIFPGPWAVNLALLALLIGPFITSELNGDDIIIGRRFIPGVGHYDALSAAVAQFLFIIPFFIGRQFLRSAGDSFEIIRILVVAGLLYSIPMLFEMRMSPQLHAWIYGYFPHSFAQQIREGGFRPVVFLGHGLLVAFFAMTAVVASSAFLRTGRRVWRTAPSVVCGYLSVILILCKSLGALVYAAVLVPLVMFTTPRFQMWVATALVTIALLYPTLRSADVVPTDEMVRLANSYSADRAQSLGFRFEQERTLLMHARERFFFGWGRFGRNRVYDESSGKDTSITDGRWVITMGQFGFVGFLAEFGLLAYPILRTVAAQKYAMAHEAVYMAVLSLLLAVNIVDLLPNSSLFPWTWLLSGALLGQTQSLIFARRSGQPTNLLDIGAYDRDKVTARRR